MTDQIDPTRGFKPVPEQVHEENSRRQKVAADKDQSGVERDRISLDSREKVAATYGPQGEFKVDSAYQLLRNLVIKTLQDQGVSINFDTAGVEINLETMTPEGAQALVADDGYFGVEQTSDRIVSFAINAFGNDPEKLQQMKDAIDQGFREAQDAFGGALPEISQKTYDAIMEKLDAFALQSNDSGE